MFKKIKEPEIKSLLIRGVLVTLLFLVIYNLAFYYNVKPVVDITAYPVKSPSILTYVMQAPPLKIDREDIIFVKVNSQNKIMPFSVIAKEGDHITLDNCNIRVNYFQNYPVTSGAIEESCEKTLEKGEYYILWKSVNNETYGTCLHINSILDYLTIPVVE